MFFNAIDVFCQGRLLLVLKQSKYCRYSSIKDFTVNTCHVTEFCSELFASVDQTIEFLSCCYWKFQWISQCIYLLINFFLFRYVPADLLKKNIFRITNNSTNKNYTCCVICIAWLRFKIKLMDVDFVSRSFFEELDQEIRWFLLDAIINANFGLTKKIQISISPSKPELRLDEENLNFDSIE